MQKSSIANPPEQILSYSITFINTTVKTNGNVNVIIHQICSQFHYFNETEINHHRKTFVFCWLVNFYLNSNKSPLFPSVGSKSALSSLGAASAKIGIYTCIRKHKRLNRNVFLAQYATDFQKTLISKYYNHTSSN